MKKRIAIIGANEFQNPLILKAKEMGFETYVYAWKSGDIGEKTADHFIPISIIEKEKIWESCKNNKVASCVSIGSDLATHTVNYIQRKLGNPCNPLITDTIATNKYEMRKALLNAGIVCPRFLKATEVPKSEKLKDFSYPLIIKPVDRSGSRGIYKVNNYFELCEVINYSCKLSFSKEAIIEEFIDGNEYSCESISFAGKHTILQITKKFTTGAPHFIETGHKEPSDLADEYIGKIKNQITKALTALQITYGASHSEFKVDKEGNVHIIEIGARMGGDCIGSDLVHLSTGFDFVRMVIDTSLGIEPSFDLINEPKESFINFIFTLNDIEKYNEIKNKYNIIREKIDYKNISEKVTDSSSRHGYYIFTK
ncbi:ATP-grasp domain-containing protein [bacterium]|nr:ATP-grasp domain-containing protein [bacterium]